MSTPRLAPVVPDEAAPLLDVRNLQTHFMTDDGVRPAVRGVIEHGAGGDEGRSGARRELRQALDAGAVVAAINMPRGEIESRAGAKRLLDAA